MFASLSPLSVLSLIIPFEVFKVLCSETFTFKLKNFLILIDFLFDFFWWFQPMKFCFLIF